MTDLLNFYTDLQVIKSNSPFPLNTRDTVWMLKGGAMAVFAIATTNGSPQGARRYLFDVNPTDVLFGIAAVLEGQSHGLIAVAYEETHLVSINLADWVKQVIANDEWETVFQPLQQWSDRLVEALQAADISLNGINLKGLDTFDLVSEHLDQFHNDVLLCLHQLDQKETLTRFEQFRSRQQLNQEASDRAIRNFTAIFRRSEVKVLPEGTALLIAAGAVGKAMGIEIRPPGKSEDPKRLKDPLEAIARASRIRLRQVILRGAWWEFDSGPILAYTAQDKRPLAVLPVGRNRYEILDPEQQRPIPLNANTADLISPVAYVFYRPFPDKVLKSLEILKFATRGTRRDWVRVLLLGAIISLLGMVTPQATAILIDNAIPSANRGLIFQLALGLLAVNFGSTMLNLVDNIAIMRAQTLAKVQTQAAMWDRLLKLPVPFFRKYTIGNLQSRVAGIQKLHQILSRSVIRSLSHSFFALLNLALLFSYSSQLALVVMGVAAVNVGMTLFSFLISRQKMIPMQELSGEISGLTVQLIGGVSKLRVAGAEERAFAYWSQMFGQQLKLMLSTEAIEDGVTLFNMILPTISSMLIYGTAILIAQAQTQGQTGFSTGTFLAFNTAFGTFISGITALSGTLIKVMEVAVIWERVQPILAEKPEVDAEKTDPGLLAGGVKLDQVSFRYQEDGPLVLDKVTIEAKPGEFIALVGPSGSGKSTIVRLLLAFEQPEQGTIYYDGQDLSGLDISAVRRQLGVVLQNGRINTGSIFKNISKGALVTIDEAWEAARMAGLAQDIEQMPMGMHTVISEGGTNLSGGQRQRLLIARSLVLKPKILIFDEATSALDNRTQAIVSESLEQLKVTRIVIAHRLSTIRNADRIYVIVAGQMMQVGSFEELMSQSGIFADLMARQLA
ncbi:MULTISPECIES: NHLP bacteriocin export ABC transporter permease/ATPase subunit [unclassified Tolypothrix]|uniref:NHLP bacteriocin export ABC transporter permease/ATPase subunit n=1 Tax=unclassified Tolypothrix TaxID=2649714 RepID=UPI0005EAAB47|nr:MULTISPECIES: NHLP bacteriocin export ABC transporter permease/ATPase subunit [unclassified Tolypothrix]EKE98332.1 ABC transporter, ATP-binding protein [Tolypothrix sp. PCC 7601]BAY95568.1 ABC transporter-related protein [Microchaete diplosiphon NIES-3275]